jgi:hypothetical protein
LSVDLDFIEITGGNELQIATQFSSAADGLNFVSLLLYLFPGRQPVT